MQIVNFPPQYQQVGASGVCPHCGTKSYLKPVGAPLQEPFTNGSGNVTIVNPVQCESCKKFGLVVGVKQNQQAQAALIALYPAGAPDETVDPNVPDSVAQDVKEALRCLWVKAYKACVVMCRRAIQSSAIAQSAKGGRLIDQIDDLAKEGKITEALRQFAHEVRLVGNDGAHPDKDGLENVTANDATDIVEFTREYLHHVYVMPAKLKARKAPAPAPNQPGG
jgi:hypothetical protein